MAKTKEQIEIEKHLSSRKWRINNLYRVVDEQGKEVAFKLNWFQTILYDNFWYLNIILKARQVGITTFMCILFLDDCLFQKDLKAAIIADTRDHAKKIFQDKIKYPFEHLPDWLRSKFNVNTDTTDMLSFNNGSSIEVATSVRSGTYQRLHISEFGKICAKTPDKATEIVTGSLNTVHKGQIITIESTAEGAFGAFYDYCQTAQAAELEGTPLTEMDYKFFFFPWYKVPHYRLAGRLPIPRELQDYFNELEQTLKITLDNEQRNWYWKKLQQQKEYMKREYPSHPDEAFASAIEGSYYGKLIDLIRSLKHVTNVPFDPKLPVDTWWDLGMNDTNVILFTQQSSTEIRIIDFYESSGEGLAHYVSVLDEKRNKYSYHYRVHNFPHDIEVRDLSTGKERKYTLLQLGMQSESIRVIPKLSIQEGIDAARSLLPRCYFDQVNCAKVVKALSAYRKEWDDKHGIFKSMPLHDENSHIADAFRQLAVGLIEELAPTGKVILPQEEEMTDDEKYRAIGLI